MPAFAITERTFEFARCIVKLCLQLAERPGVSRRLGDQLFRAGTSIGANVEEGQAGQSRADFISKYAIALKEARETSYWLRLIKVTLDTHQTEVQELLEEVEELKRILGAIICRAKENS